MPSTVRPRHEAAFLRAVPVGVAYVLAVQLAFLVMPFTTETLWLWFFGAAEAIGDGRLLEFLGSAEWWLALAFPFGIFALGALGAYSYLAYGNPWPAAIAGGFLLVFYLTEVVFVGRFEYAILYVALTPLVALAAAAAHLLAPQRRAAGAS